jgi:predicted RNA-binding Zn ribbon-like protein
MDAVDDLLAEIAHAKVPLSASPLITGNIRFASYNPAMNFHSGFQWAAHRFAGGALAFDVANSVILRHDPERRIDRFANPAAVSEFAKAAGRMSVDARHWGQLEPVPETGIDLFIDLRERIDRHFRALASGDAKGLVSLAALLSAIAGVLGEPGIGRNRLDAATAISALRLAADPPPERIRTCRNCGWLLVDRSRNRSRAWCDMAVCGNREKARRHYNRIRKGEAA